MEEILQKFNVRVSYSIQSTDDLSAEISALATEHNGTLNELVLDSADELVMTLTFFNSNQLFDFVAKCTKKLKFKIISIEKDEEIYRKIKFLSEKIDKRIDSFKERRGENRRKTIRLKFLSLSLASLTTILLGINGLNTSSKLLFQNVAFILSAITTFLTALDTFFNYRALWIRYTVTLNELYELKDNLEYLCTNETINIVKEDLDRLYQQYQRILNETNTNWTELRKEQKSGGNS